MHAQHSIAQGVIIQDVRPDARLRLFCFPYAGGGASIYHSWAKKAPPGVELCAVQLPGREARIREPPFRAMEPLLQYLELCLQPYLDRPFAFFGHSMGALIGFELARRLAMRGLPLPCHMFVSGSRAPHLLSATQTYNLSDAALIDTLGRWQGTPAELLGNAEMLALVLPYLRADLEVVETHVAVNATQLACPISAFGGMNDLQVNRQQLAAWDQYTRGPFKMRLLPGGHFFLQRERDIILSAVRQDLQASAG